MSNEPTMTRKECDERYKTLCKSYEKIDSEQQEIKSLINGNGEVGVFGKLEIGNERAKTLNSKMDVQSKDIKKLIESNAQNATAIKVFIAIVALYVLQHLMSLIFSW